MSIYQAPDKRDATIAAQAATIAQLREALEPFAYAAKIIDSYSVTANWRDTKKIVYGVTVDGIFHVGDLRRAARALRGE